MAQIIALNTDEFRELKHLPPGTNVKLTLNATVIDRQQMGPVVFEVKGASVSTTSEKGRFNILLDIHKRVLHELEQIPKVKPLGHTGQL